MSKMKEAFNAIRKEREYQDRLWGRTPTKGLHSVAEWILYIQDYIQEAGNAISRNASPGCDEEALHSIRKVAAMAVCCMEQNGIFERDMKDLDKALERHGVVLDEPKTNC
jgi:hypothetical protein